MLHLLLFAGSAMLCHGGALVYHRDGCATTVLCSDYYWHCIVDVQGAATLGSTEQACCGEAVAMWCQWTPAWCTQAQCGSQWRGCLWCGGVSSRFDRQVGLQCAQPQAMMVPGEWAGIIIVNIACSCQSATPQWVSQQLCMIQAVFLVCKTAADVP